MEENKYYYTNNKLAGLLKHLSIIIATVNITWKVLTAISLNGDMESKISIIVSGIIVSFFEVLGLFSLGEIIEILHDIRTNTEHIRNNQNIK